LFIIIFHIPELLTVTALTLRGLFLLLWAVLRLRHRVFLCIFYTASLSTTLGGFHRGLSKIFFILFKTPHSHAPAAERTLCLIHWTPIKILLVSLSTAFKGLRSVRTVIFFLNETILSLCTERAIHHSALAARGKVLLSIVPLAALTTGLSHPLSTEGATVRLIAERAIHSATAAEVVVCKGASLGLKSSPITLSAVRKRLRSTVLTAILHITLDKGTSLRT
jgi:hypothetical protein